jgi:hypothetical protein
MFGAMLQAMSLGSPYETTMPTMLQRQSNVGFWHRADLSLTSVVQG